MKYILIFLFIFLISGCTNTQILNVNTYDVKKQEQTENKIYYGYIDRGLDVELSFALSGKITNIYATEGKAFKKGQLLAKIDNDEVKFKIDKTQNALNDSRVKFKRLKSYSERVEKLYKAGGISYNDYEAATSDVESAINQINMAQNELQIAKKQEEHSNIYAPYDGIVLRVYKDTGNFAYQGDKVILYQGIGEIEARFFVIENEINSIQIGTKVQIKADSISNKSFNGEIKSILKTSMNEGGYRVTVTIEENCEQLMDGMNVEVVFTNSTEIISIPKECTFYENLVPYVFVLDKNTSTINKRKISYIENNNSTVTVENGLTEGETILKPPFDRLYEGAKVQYE